jgi:hypothetical protein
LRRYFSPDAPICHCEPVRPFSAAPRVAISPLPFPPKAGISVHRRSSADGLAFPVPGVYPERSERASSPILHCSILYCSPNHHPSLHPRRRDGGDKAEPTQDHLIEVCLHSVSARAN